MSDIVAYKISDKLYRVRNPRTVKDVWIKFGKIQPPTNPHNILTPTEQQAVELQLKNDKAKTKKV